MSPIHHCFPPEHRLEARAELNLRVHSLQHRFAIEAANRLKPALECLDVLLRRHLRSIPRRRGGCRPSTAHSETAGCQVSRERAVEPLTAGRSLFLEPVVFRLGLKLFELLLEGRSEDSFWLISERSLEPFPESLKHPETAFPIYGDNVRCLA